MAQRKNILVCCASVAPTGAWDQTSPPMSVFSHAPALPIDQVLKHLAMVGAAIERHRAQVPQRVVPVRRHVLDHRRLQTDLGDRTHEVLGGVGVDPEGHALSRADAADVVLEMAAGPCCEVAAQGADGAARRELGDRDKNEERGKKRNQVERRCPHRRR